MVYLSRLLNRTVVDSANVRVGKLVDVLIYYEPGAYPPLSFLLVRHPHRNLLYIPYRYVANMIEGEIAITHSFAHIDTTESLELTDPPPNLVFLSRDVIDKQIVDIEGARVVRVNDLHLGVFNGQTCVLAIDISIRGILRRLGVERWIFFHWLEVRLIDWRKVQLAKRKFLKLDTVSKKLMKLHPADLATIVEDLSVKEGGALLRSLDTKTAAHVMEEAGESFQKAFIRYLGPERAAPFLERMSSDEVADLIKLFPRKEARQYLALLNKEKAKSVEGLLRYRDDTAGGLMTTDFVTVRPEWTVTETMEYIKTISHAMRSIFYVYVTDETNCLKGLVSLRNLLVANPEEKVGRVMKRISRHATLRVHHKLRKMMIIMTRYNLNTVAVVDNKDTLLGVVTIDDIMRLLHPAA
ncbi:MAG: magnesium transporter [Candidatus Magasanikbacteria bacterium]|nr:magnesium transporter [Candidatus Magasanikbacteria bacterium]